MAVKAKLTIAEQIDRAADGRSQTSIVEKMIEAGSKDMTEVKFSRKKLARAGDSFTKEDLEILSQVLGTAIEA